MKCFFAGLGIHQVTLLKFCIARKVISSSSIIPPSQEGVGRAERGERRNVRVLKANYIHEFSVVGTYDNPLDPAGCVLDLAAIHAREEAALRSSAISLLQKIRELGGIAIMHTLVACLHQTEPEQRVLAANLLLQLDMLQQQIKSKIGPTAAVVVSARQKRNDAIVELREKQGKKLVLVQSSKNEVPIGPLPWAPLSRCSSDPSANQMELAKAHFMDEEDHPRR
ncbi:hypothetical protein ZWY2020_029081 [Hordeum vulgare]|nr:hypothetical protein ZWY2020_029081 [Hordeum vulgare]